MRNEDVAEAMKQLESNFKQYTDAQLAAYTKLLEQYISTTDSRIGQLHQQVHEWSRGKMPTAFPSATKEDHGNPDSPSSLTGELSPSDLSAILKVLKVDVPKFHGSHVHNRIYNIKNFFCLYAVLESLCLQVVAFHLECEAASWYQWMDQNGSLISWDKFLLDLQECFGSSIYDDPLGRISKLTQIGRVSQLRAEFEELMNRLSGVSEHMLLNFFLWGLKTEIRRELLIHPPQSLTEAMMKAQLFEDRNNSLRGLLRHNGPGEFAAASGRLSLPQSSTVSKIPIRKLTPVEIQEKRNKGLCYSWDEKCSPAHRCNNRIMILFGDEEDTTLTTLPEDTNNIKLDDNEIEPEVSLHTLTNISNLRIFVLTTTLHKHLVEVFIDMGSHNNFIQRGAV